MVNKYVQIVCTHTKKNCLRKESKMGTRLKVDSYEKSSLKLEKKYSDAVYKIFLEERYGIAPCCNSKSIEQIEAEKLLCDWKVMTADNSMSDSQIRYFANLPVYVNSELGTTSNTSEYNYSGTSSNSASIVYNTGLNGLENIVEINAGGSVTRINLNSVINVDNSPTDQYVHEQAEPSINWIIEHNLGFVPGNQLVTDLDGNEIEGVTRPLDNNTLRIEFSEPIAGWAYLS